MNKEDYHRAITVRLFQTSNALQAFLDRILKSEQLTAKQFFMMIMIGSFEHNPKLGELADRFGTSHQNVKQVLLKLQKQGFVLLYKDEQDSRITRTSFTEKAEQFWHKRDEEDLNTMNQLYSTLSLPEMDGLLSGLNQIQQQIEKMTNR